MGQIQWQYTSVRDGVEQFVFTPDQGRSKMTENPRNPELELISYMKKQNDCEVLLLSPCSEETYTKATELVDEVIVIDHSQERLQLFKKKNTAADIELIRNGNELSSILKKYKNSLEQGRVRSYLPERFAKLDKTLKSLLYDDLLKIQKEEASFAINRSLKRWHTNTNLLINIKSLKAVAQSFPKLSVPHVIVGAGPSLDENIQTLKRYSGNAIIVATDGSVQSLIANNIKPDYIVSKEDTLMSWRFVAGIESYLKEIPLFLDSKGNNYLAKNYPGPVVLTRTSHFEKWISKVADKLLLLETGSCVGHMAFNFAIACGASEIIMVGFDLAYRDDVFHPKDMPVPYFHGMVTPEIDYVEGYDGKRLRTDISMKVYLRHFEEMINQTQIPVIDATEGGALIKGASIQKLSDALKAKVEILKNLHLSLITTETDLLSTICEDINEAEMLEPFTSYLVQNGANYSEIDKQEDRKDAERYLEILKKCPISNGMNKAAFVTDDVSGNFIKWAEEKGLCIYSPSDLTQSLKYCKDLGLSVIYCCNGAVDPDLLSLTDASIFDVKTNEKISPFERCLWNPQYKVLSDARVAEFWQQTLPDDVDFEVINLLAQECEHGMP